MAISTPIPAPPRTPTPPPDDGPSAMTGLGLDGIGDLLSPTNDGYDPCSLAPMSENFSASRYGTSPPKASSGPLSPASPNSLYGSFSSDGNGANGGPDGKNPFNFQPMSLAKSPVMKSVRTSLLLSPLLQHKQDIILTRPSKHRASANAAATNTNTAPSPTKYSSSLPPAPPSPSPTPSTSPPSPNVAAACPASRKPASGGASAT